MGDVGDGVFDLLLGEGAPAPVGETRGLVQPGAVRPLHELVVADGIAESADHGSDLGIEDRVRDQAAAVIDDLDILPGGVKDLDDLLVAHQFEERLKVEIRRLGVNDHGFVRACQLDNA